MNIPIPHLSSFRSTSSQHDLPTPTLFRSAYLDRRRSFTRLGRSKGAFVKGADPHAPPWHYDEP